MLLLLLIVIIIMISIIIVIFGIIILGINEIDKSTVIDTSSVEWL